jgi:signal peptidase I
MNKKRFFNILLACFTTVTVLLAGFIVVLTLTQTKAYTVQSGSMSPALKINDAVFVRPANAEELRAGDIITVNTPDGSRSFTHRITRIDTQKALVYTKGDANKGEDPMPADMSLVAGRVWFTIPYIGLISAAVQSRMFLITLAILAALLAGVRMILSVRKNKNGGGTDAAKQK